MIISMLQEQHDLWESVCNYAQNCSWKAGSFLAKQMREKLFTDWERVFVVTDESSIAGYCAFVKKDCIPNVDYTPYISFVFVGEEYRGNRLSEKLIKSALNYAKKIGFSKVFLVSGEMGLYEKYGFKKIEDAKDYWGKDEQIFCIET